MTSDGESEEQAIEESLALESATVTRLISGSR